jgi:hypothetical protein
VPHKESNEIKEMIKTTQNEVKSIDNQKRYNDVTKLQHSVFVTKIDLGEYFSSVIILAHI